MTDKDGTVVWEMRLTPFGETAVLDQDPDQDGNELVSNLRFPGQYYDEETGLHYNWNRYYDISMGNFITLDRLATNGDEYNYLSYLYVHDNPLVVIDNNGLSGQSQNNGGDYWDKIAEMRRSAWKGCGLPGTFPPCDQMTVNYCHLYWGICMIKSADLPGCVIHCDTFRTECLRYAILDCQCPEK